MKGFLIFLAIAFPVVLASPTFWSLVNMNFGAERVGYIREGGVTQWAWLGPKSPWPQWALVPDDAELAVGAHFEAAPGEIASGFGDVELKDTRRATTDVYMATLTRAGWTVTTSYLDTMAPDAPPHRVRLCFIEARKAGRSLRLTLDRAMEGGNASLHWAEGDVPAMKHAVPGPC